MYLTIVDFMFTLCKQGLTEYLYIHTHIHMYTCKYNGFCTVSVQALTWGIKKFKSFPIKMEVWGSQPWVLDLREGVRFPNPFNPTLNYKVQCINH